MNFEFATATRIVFGPGRIGESGAIAAGLGSKALVVTGKNPDRAAPLLASLKSSKVRHTTYAISGEPTIEHVVHGAALALRKACDFVVAFGGGSAIDAGKAIAAMMTNPGDPLDYLEVVGQGLPLQARPSPFVAIPTTAGTGAEVTRNAVLGVREQRVKVSLRSPMMLPTVALVDPELTLKLPPKVTATTGLDALTQLIEPFLSARANPLTDAICLEGLRLAARSLRRTFENGSDLQARTDMGAASLFGGLALANSGLGAVHGFAAPIGGMFPAPHGAVCAALLPEVFAMNHHVLKSRNDDKARLERFQWVARTLTGRSRAGVAAGVQWLRETVHQLKIPKLSKWGVNEREFDEIVEKAGRASSMKGNPVALESDQLRSILSAAT